MSAGLAVGDQPARAREQITQSEFERRELEHRRKRVGFLDGIAETRAASLEHRRYYGDSIRDLVASLVVPKSRVLEVGCGIGDLIASLDAKYAVGIDVSPRMIERAKQRHPGVTFSVCDVVRDPLPEGPFDAIVMSDTIGLLDDVESAFDRLRPLLAPRGRVIVTYYSFIWEPVIKLAERLGLRTRWPDQNWLGMTDIENLFYLSGFEVFRRGTHLLMPLYVPLVSWLANRVLAKLPLVRRFSLVNYFVARPVPESPIESSPTVSIVCPCRNEKGNIREAVRRTPPIGAETELIFVDGNSSDGTVEEIEAVMREYRGPLRLRLVHQGDGRGKGDAVRKGFAAATNDVLMILDSDLTVPPEDLPKFYRALVTGKGEFINGVRLVYPLEGQAMQSLNLIGNKFFSLALSWILEQRIKDSLCGTKVLYRKEYQLIAANRDFFGEFDPFGDFDLLFGAARLNLRIADLPVRYRARTYGDTKISRFSHGWLLLKMTAFGFVKLRMRI